MQHVIRCPFFHRAFGWCVPIGGLSGLIGLGGGEFRLPVLMYAIGFNAKEAVPLNLMVSLVTLAFSMMVRSRTISVIGIVPYMPEVMGLAAGGMLSAFFGARLVHVITSERLVQLIAGLLACVGCLMMWEVFFPFQNVDFLPAGTGVHFAVGAVIGIGIGLVSSVLGVAGGELLIPTLIFIFGMDIRLAGSASILISLTIVVMGIWRYWRMAALPQGGGVVPILTGMSAGSIIGAALGGLAVAYAPTAILKVVLGCVLIAAAAKTIHTHRNRS